MSNWGRYLKIASLVIIVIGLMAGLVLVGRRLSLRPKADLDKAEISFNPTDLNTNLVINLPTGQNLAFARVTIQIPAGFAINISAPAVSGYEAITNQTQGNNYIYVVRILPNQTAVGSITAPVTITPPANFTQTTAINIDTNASQVVGTDETQNYTGQTLTGLTLTLVPSSPTTGNLRTNIFQADRYWAYNCQSGVCTATTTKSLTELAQAVADQTAWEGFPFPTDTIDAISQYYIYGTTTLRTNVFKANRLWGYTCDASGCNAVITTALSDAFSGVTKADAVDQYYLTGTSTLRTNIFTGDHYSGYNCDGGNCSLAVTKTLTELAGAIGDKTAWAGHDFPTTFINSIGQYYLDGTNTLRTNVFSGDRYWAYECDTVGCRAVTTKSLAELTGAISDQTAWAGHTFPNSTTAVSQYYIVPAGATPTGTPLPTPTGIVVSGATLRSNIFKDNRYFGYTCDNTGCKATITAPLPELASHIATQEVWDNTGFSFPKDSSHIDAIGQYTLPASPILHSNIFVGNRYWAYNCLPTVGPNNCWAVLTRDLSEVKATIGNQSVWAGHDFPTDRIDAISQYYLTGTTTLRTNIFKDDRYWGYTCDSGSCNAVATKAMSEAFPEITSAKIDAVEQYYLDGTSTLRTNIFVGDHYWGYNCDTNNCPLAVNKSLRELASAISDKTAWGSYSLPTDAIQALGQYYQVPAVTSGHAVLTFRVKFQGIDQDRPNRKVRVILRNNIFRRQEDAVVLTHIDNGVYQGQITGLPAGVYDLFVKGPFHLQKELAGISLNDGANGPFDLTSTPLLAGDFLTNNIINVQDLMAIISVWQTGGALALPVTTDTEKFDVNADGFIRVTDILTVLPNWTSLAVPGDHE